MFGFLGGMASGAGKELDDQESRAFALKLKNRQIEGELENAQQMADYNSVDPNTSKTLREWSGIAPAEGSMNAASAQAALGMGRSNNAVKAAGAKGRGGAKYDRQALIESVLKNPQVFDDLTPTAKADIFPDLQKGGFKRGGKPLTEGMQLRADAATNGLKSLARVNERLNVSSDEFAKLFAPGSIGAKNLRGDLNEIMDIVTRVRTGAALNKDEQTFYRSQLIADELSTLIDDVIDGGIDGDTIKYRLNTIYKPYLEDMAKMQERRERNTVESANPLGTADDAASWRAKRNAPKVP